MATDASRRAKSSEETFDYTCTLCSKKNKVSEAVKYCQECHKNFCTSCLEQHDYYMDDHTLVDPSAAGSGVVMPTERCQQHGQKLMEMWCKKHDEVLCNTCAFMDHRSCDEVKFIPGEADKLLQDAELQETIDSLRQTRERLVTLKNERSLAREELLTEKNKYLNMVDRYQKKIIQIVESLGKAAREEINNWYEDNKDKCDKDKDCCDELERDTVTCIKQLETPSVNKPQLFVSMKKGQKVLKTTKEITDERVMQRKPKAEFEINQNIEGHLAGIQSLGSFKKQNHLYKATEMKQINIKVDSDAKLCNIFDTCLLLDGSTLMADNSNKKLKRLNSSTYTITDQCDLRGNPYGVCCVGPQEVAVSLSNRKVQFVSVGNVMTLTRSFTVDHYCYGIVYCDKELYVSDASSHVYVYNLAGTLLRTISHTQSGNALFLSTRHLAVSGDNVYIADCDRGLICIDRNGTELFRYRGTQVKRWQGVCTDGQGGVFLCGFQSHNVVQIGADGEELGVVLTRADGLKNPLTVHFDTGKQKLIVANCNSSDILLFDLV